MQRFDLEEVLALDPSEGLAGGLTFFRIKPRAGAAPPPPLPLDVGDTSVAPRDARRVFTVGHPFRDPRMPEAAFVNVFPPPYGVKRVALGELVAPGPGAPQSNDLTHDCSTSAGDGGAPLVRVDDGKVVGLHYAGEYLKGNSAVPIGRILTHPKVRELKEIKELRAAQ